MREDLQTNITSTSTTPTHRAWVKEGILYHEYIGELSLSDVLAVQEASVALLQSYVSPTIPIIIILKNIDMAGFKLSIADYGKAISGLGLVKRISEGWIVGATGKVANSISVINKIFFRNRLHMVYTLEEALVAAHKAKTQSESLLEKE